jgi:mercuric ion transport protein
MNDSALIKTGAIGAVVAAICCATPILVIALGAVGLSAWAGYLDAVLLPILALCIGVLGYGLYKRRRNAAECCAPQSKSN